MQGSRRKSACRALAWAAWQVVLLFMLLGGGFSPIYDANSAYAQSGGNAAALVNLRGQIRRYGCHLPQYAKSVAGCRSLHERVRALESGRSASPRKPYPRYSNTSARPGTRPAQPQASRDGGGIFGGLFGGSSASRSTNRYNSYGSSYPSSPAYGLNGWSGSYPSYMRGYGRYRTLCVRTCDGYYWPVSFSTTRAGIARDAERCESSCAVPAKLFYHRNPGADVQHMVDLNGQPYATTENAFRYREEYVKNCRCKPQPWSEAAKQVYERRAEQAGNPDQVETAANEAGGETMTDALSGPAAAGERDYSRPAPQPERRRTRYRANDPALEGRWWAGSW